MPVGCQSGKSVGVGGPKGGIGHTGTIVSAPFARENPRPLPLATAPESLGSGGPAFWPLPVRRPLSAGVGGVGGQRLHLAKSVLGGQSVASGWCGPFGHRWPVGGQSVSRCRVGSPAFGHPVRSPLSAGGGRGSRWPKASLSQVGLRWPVGGGPGEGVPLPSLCGQWGPPGWPVRAGAKAARLWPSPFGQWVTSEGVAPSLRVWPKVASEGGGGRRWPVGGLWAVSWPVGASEGGLFWPVGGQ